MEKETYQLDTAALRELAEACTCTHMRIAARVITQFYDTFLQPSGLRMTQFIVLVVIHFGEQQARLLRASLKSIEELRASFELLT